MRLLRDPLVESAASQGSETTLTWIGNHKTLAQSALSRRHTLECREAG